MPIIMPYDPKVEVLWATPDPLDVVASACSVTHKGAFALGADQYTDKERLIHFLHRAGHHSPFEHAVISLDITQISRACADQLRTHRMASHTMSSTHYQDHSGYVHRVSYDVLADPMLQVTIDTSMAGYALAIKTGLLKEDARQLLPLSTETRVILTINARSLAHMLPLRMCYRNTIETVLLAERIREVVYSWFPVLFACAMRPCDYDSIGCREGKMACNMAAAKKRAEQYA